MSDFWLRIINSKNTKRLEKIDKELKISIRWWYWWLPEDENNRAGPIFTHKVEKC